MLGAGFDKLLTEIGIHAEDFAGLDAMGKKITDKLTVNRGPGSDGDALMMGDFRRDTGAGDQIV